MAQEVETLKPRLKDPRLDKRFLKELMIRLIYIEMLGHDASWGHVKALQACSETNLITKKVHQDHAQRFVLLTFCTYRVLGTMEAWFGASTSAMLAGAL